MGCPPDLTFRSLAIRWIALIFCTAINHQKKYMTFLHTQLLQSIDGCGTQLYNQFTWSNRWHVNELIQREKHCTPLLWSNKIIATAQESFGQWNSHMLRCQIEREEAEIIPRKLHWTTESPFRWNEMEWTIISERGCGYCGWRMWPARTQKVRVNRSRATPGWRRCGWTGSPPDSQSITAIEASNWHHRGQHVWPVLSCSSRGQPQGQRTNNMLACWWQFLGESIDRNRSNKFIYSSFLRIPLSLGL